MFENFFSFLAEAHETLSEKNFLLLAEKKCKRFTASLKEFVLRAQS
jgi:uncharacterized protein (DUF1778 family)